MPDCRRFLLAFILFLLPSPAGSPAMAQLVSGEAIRTEAGEGQGRFALPGIAAKPLGIVVLNGDDARPALIDSSDKWYPGLNLYRTVGFSEQSAPIFSQGEPVGAEFLTVIDPPGSVIQSTDGEVYGIWSVKNKWVLARFNQEEMAFRQLAESPIEGLPREPRALTAVFRPDDSIDLFVSIADGTRYKAPGDFRDPEYRPYRPDGIWNGGIPRDAVYQITLTFPGLESTGTPRLICPHEEGGLFGVGGLAVWQSDNGNEGGDLIIYGDKMGMFHAFQPGLAGTGDPAKYLIVGPDRNLLRRPGTWSNPVVCSPDGIKPGLIVSGEGDIVFYPYRTTDSNTRTIVFDSARPVLQQSSEIYAGSLIVPTATDWDADGDVDIIAGNS